MPWHLIFESLAYFIAFRLYLRERGAAGDFLDTHTRWSVVAAAIGGAAVGSKLLFWMEDPQRTLAHWRQLEYMMGGKTMVGALLGGVLAVEWIKGRLGVTRRTGDLFAIPIAVGIAIGRVGCSLTGIHDDTHGLPTSMPWGLDFGDGTRRHPVALFESVAMMAMVMLLRQVRPPRFAEGDRFRLFLTGYCGWRLAVDFLKPGVRFGDLTVLQWCCAAALAWYARDVWRILRPESFSKGAVSNG